MGEPVILFVKHKAISPDDKKTLKEAGVLVVEIDDPRNAKFTRANTELSAGTLLNAAAEAIGTNSRAREEFGRAVCAAVDAEYGDKS